MRDLIDVRDMDKIDIPEPPVAGDVTITIAVVPVKFCASEPPRYWPVERSDQLVTHVGSTVLAAKSQTASMRETEFRLNHQTMPISPLALKRQRSCRASAADQGNLPDQDAARHINRRNCLQERIVQSPWPVPAAFAPCRANPSEK